ncbi:hypothetical protein KC332_g10012 [Hortaea werneckii]|uniref:Uncharacterized protein n=1 Tax=Hortaea werneckii TaxID=91943 RepID=A0A3M7IET6_HORWE|nr:hypothetical protein KC358_g9930 [Hortaea werneckii]KAI6822291.1 hypothetical protein KC350_g9401 [Hortaea werneckii]KAI6921751.1 hypothetical protein KC348_g10038 [Hortaea werneckii]KAI6931393.1 hypothetical protein KC341_g9645 [Hortaea werneckii]KAI6965639.1 hypothetical protein KC321_g10008 [Hortaea werneckii]
MADVQEASLDSIDTDATFETTDSGIEDRFHAQWQQEDTAHLQPSNLPIARVQRAWERRPLSPLSRRKLRVGKVWKRPSQAQNNAVTRPTLAAEDGSGNDQRGTKRFKARSSVNSPLKPVKKLCLDSDYGLAPRVAVWDGRPAGSPTRKIVTRSRFANGTANEELLELDGDEADGSNAQGEEDSKIEFFDDQGALLDEDSADSGVWEDEEVYDPTMMHLEDAVHHKEVPRDSQDGQRASQADTEHQKQADSPIESSYQTEETAAEQNDNAQGVQQSPDHAPSTFTASHQAVDLPEGFVSPVRQRRKLRAGSFKKASGSRRETLPAQFAPPSDSPVTTETIEDAHTSRVEHPAAPNPVPASHAEAPTQATPGANDGAEVADAGRGAENEWEDVEDEAETMSSHHLKTSADEGTDEEHSTSFVLPVDSLGGAPASDLQPEDKEQDQTESESAQNSPRPADASGLPSPKVALRHSPRRKSTSPLKPSALAPRADQPHYVAFTPIKQSNLSVYKDVPDSRGQDEATTPPSNTSCAEPSSSLPDRALSAPAEEPSQTSPRRQAKPPRVSDDTALLQAFLNRAAERRSGRRVSATEQEALFHRRDSDVVKAALASPGKALDGTGTHEVLGELDSNRHSPKRTAPAQSEATAKDVGTTDKPVDSHAAAESVSSEGEARHQEVPEDPIEEAQSAASNTRSGSTGSASRRSDRSRRKPQGLAQQANTGPSRITIRGPHQTNAGISESNKRTEAQELALATKNNTRKNKGGSVLPMQRLNKLAKAAAGELGGVGDLNAEAATEESEDADANGKPGKKGVRWAETLVSFYQGSGTLADLAQLSDAGAEERMPWERPALASEDEETDKADAQSEGAGEEVVPAAPAPADTPSKPKGKTRKMRTPRTASAAGSTTSGADTEMKDSKGEETAPGPQQPQEETHSQPPAKPRTASQARRSRIATPAKSSATSAQPSANVPQQQQQPHSQPATEPAKRTAPPPKKRTMTSRLPAPSSTSTTSSAAAPTLGSGKENLISSPPKKRTAAPSQQQQQQQSSAGIPNSKTFAPKLDFNDGKPATKFEQPTPSAPAGHTEGTSMPGLQSPARKTGARRAGNAGAGALFNGSSSLRQQEGRSAAHGGGAGSGGQGEGEVPMGLRSPAKRRVTRRTGV